MADYLYRRALPLALPRREAIQRLVDRFAGLSVFEE